MCRLSKRFYYWFFGSKEAVEVLPRIIDKASIWKDDIIFTMDCHHKNYLSTYEGKYLPVEHCIIEDYEGWALEKEIVKILDNSSHSYHLYKDTFGSFDLVKQIKLNFDKTYHIFPTTTKLDSITLIGYCTDICILVNAMILKTAFPETEIIVDASCCAGSTPEAHEAALLVMKNCQIKIINE